MLFNKKANKSSNDVKMSRARQVMRYLLVLFFLALLIVISLYSSQKRTKPKSITKSKIVNQTRKIKIPAKPTSTFSPSERKPFKAKPKIAIIIDDFGYNLKRAEEFVELDCPITLSILPKLRYSKKIAELAKANNKSVILHLPMEPRGRIYPGPGAIYVRTKPEIIKAIIKSDLDTIPGADGVNNHEGSKATADTATMTVVLGYLKSQGLFFIDSATTYDSVSKEVGRRINLRIAERDIFLDNEDDLDYIKGQIRQLIDIAQKNGYAIGLGHPKANTLQAIKEMIPVFREENIELVFVKDLL